jgi:anti-sigma B factor antagonist
MSDQLLSTRFERSDGLLLVFLSGEIDLSNSRQLHHELEVAVEGHARVVIDLTEITYLDSQGLRLIKQLSDKVDASGSELQLVAPPGTFARQVFEMARMSDYVQIRDRLEG